MLNTKNISALVLFLLLGLTQISYFIPAGGFLSAGLVFALFATLVFQDKWVFNASDVKIIFLFLTMPVLAAVLYFFNEPGQFQLRSIFVFNVLQFIAVAILINSINKNYGAATVFNILIILMGIELFVLIGQFTFVTYGVGFSKIAENFNEFGFISGTNGNPNDSAAQLGLMAFAATAYLTMQGKKFNGYILMALILPGLFLTLSRTMMAFWVLNIICIILSSVDAKLGINVVVKLKKIIVLLFFLLVSFAIYLKIDGSDVDVFNRSIQRLETFGQIANDNSIGFRAISHLRLFENFLGLGLGSFSDLNYYQFFKPTDDWLMKVNPHSYVVEYSFLFGYFGFVIVSLIFLLLSCLIVFRSGVPHPFKFAAIIGLFFIQAVPSSLLTDVYFFCLFVYLIKIKKQAPQVL